MIIHKLDEDKLGIIDKSIQTQTKGKTRGTNGQLLPLKAPLKEFEFEKVRENILLLH